MVPLVLIPAMLCDAELYAAQVAALGDVADITIAPVADRPLPEAAQAFLRSAPPRFGLGGTSAGGNLALEILATAPERVVGFWLMGSNPGAHGDPDGARANSARVRAGEFFLGEPGRAGGLRPPADPGTPRRRDPRGPGLAEAA